METGQFDPAALLERIRRLPATARFWVGFSGGADSTALLLALSELRNDLPAELQAVHFNHNLQAAAGSWQEHCLSFCEHRGIPLLIRPLALNVGHGKSPEELARHQRYKEIKQLLGEGEIYLTAHHADDNAETLFLNLMRGSGIDGLAAIPQLRKLGKGLVARPLLDVGRVSLEDYLRARDVTWLQDPSNFETDFDRNFIRNGVFPELEKRWPGVVARLSQAARHARELATAVNELLLKQHGRLIIDDFTVALEPLLQLEKSLQAMLLRLWIRDQGIITPPRIRLAEFLNQLNTTAAGGSQAELRWSGWMLKRHGAFVWLHPLPCPDACPRRPWLAGVSMDLNHGLGELRMDGKAIPIPNGLEIGPRRPGARMQTHPGGPRRSLNELLRERGIPPWLRDSVPVLYWDGSAAAVGDFLLCPDFRDFLSGHGLTYRWLPRLPLLLKLQSVSVHSSYERV